MLAAPTSSTVLSIMSASRIVCVCLVYGGSSDICMCHVEDEGDEEVGEDEDEVGDLGEGDDEVCVIEDDEEGEEEGHAQGKAGGHAQGKAEGHARGKAEGHGGARPGVGGSARAGVVDEGDDELAIVGYDRDPSLGALIGPDLPDEDEVGPHPARRSLAFDCAAHGASGRGTGRVMGLGKGI